MIFVNNGTLVHKQVGALPEAVLKDLFEQFIKIAKEGTPQAIRFVFYQKRFFLQK